MPVCVGPTVAIGQRLARSLAKVKEATWEDKVNLQLFSKCPQPSEQREGVFNLTTAGQEAVIALGDFIFYLYIGTYLPTYLGR